MKNKELNIAFCVLSDILKRWQLIIFVILLTGISFDLYKTYTYQPNYATSATVSLTTKDNSYTNLDDVHSYITTLNYVLNGDVVKDYARSQSHIKNLDYKCTVSSISDTNIANVNVVSDTKKGAIFTSKYIVEWYKKNSKRLNFKYDMKVINPPSIPVVPINTNHHLSNVKRAGLLGGIIIVSLLVMLSLFSSRVKSAADIEKNVDSDLIRKIPFEKKPRKRRSFKRSKKAILINTIDVSFGYKEAMKKLRTFIEEKAHKHNHKTIMITSALENEGKSSISTNLALALAKKKYNVLLVDADIRKPSMYKIFEYETELGLNAYLEGKANWQSQVVQLEKEKLSVMFIKQDLEHAEELMTKENLSTFFKEARNEYDFIIVDSSPSCYLNEPLVLNNFMDETAIVVKQNVASYKLINDTIHRLTNVKDNVIGCIYNASYRETVSNKSSYGYRYGYGRYGYGERRR